MGTQSSQTDVSTADLYRELIASFNGREFERGAELIAEDAEQVDYATGKVEIGPAGRVRVFESSIDGFSDARTEITRIISDGQTCLYEAIYRGTHDGPLTIGNGDTSSVLPATGRVVEIPFAGIVIGNGTKIIYAAKYYDSATYEKQLA